MNSVTSSWFCGRLESWTLRFVLICACDGGRWQVAGGKAEGEGEESSVKQDSIHNAAFDKVAAS